LSCPKRHVEVHYCDLCGEELDDVYEVDGEELCESCLKEKFIKTRSIL
jgi:formylmethanofuran dehydrogenase subunit E